MSTLGTQRIHAHTTSIPYWGQWRCDAILEGGDVPSGVVDLDIAGLAMRGTVDAQSSGFDAPDRPHVIVIGGIGWLGEVAASNTWSLSYYADAGVRLSTLLAALATAAGETIEQPDDVTIGQHYGVIATRVAESRLYRDALATLVRAGLIVGWYVDATGTTRFAERATAAVASRATLMRAHADVGLRVYGIDDASAFVPGATVEDVAIGRSVIVETPGSLVVECWR